MEFMFNAIVMMMLVAFPVGLFLGTLDEYSTDISPGAARHVRRSVQPTLVSIAAAHGRGVADLARESSPFHVDDAMPDLGRIRPPPANDSAPARRKLDELLQLPATNISLAAKLT